MANGEIPKAENGRSFSGISRKYSLASGPPRLSRKSAGGSFGKPLSKADQRKLRDLIEAKGIQEVARQLGQPNATVARAAAGAGLRAGTHLQFHDRLAHAGEG